jgi:hypothetical protein
LEIIFPEAFILCAIYMNVDAKSVSLVIFPLSFIDITICVPELTLTVGLVLSPFTFILGTIGPDLGTWTMT